MIQAPSLAPLAAPHHFLPSPLWRRAPRLRRIQQLLPLCPLWGRKVWGRGGGARVEDGKSLNSPCGPSLGRAPQRDPK